MDSVIYKNIRKIVPITKQTISLKTAVKIAQAALEYAKSNGFKPLVVVILDSGGHLKTYLAEDDTGLLRFNIALGKAWGCLGMGFAGREFERRAASQPLFINSLQAMSDGKVVPVRGGVLIRSESGHIIGSIGISGDTSHNDELCAIHGIKVAGLIADHGDAE